MEFNLPTLMEFKGVAIKSRKLIPRKLRPDRPPENSDPLTRELRPNKAKNHDACARALNNGERSLEFYPKNRRPVTFSTYKRDFGRESLCPEFLEPLFSSRLVLKAISSCFSKQICGRLQLYKDGWKRRKEYNSVWVSSVFKVLRQFSRSIFARKKVK